jgi:hypothetical protein
LLKADWLITGRRTAIWSSTSCSPAWRELARHDQEILTGERLLTRADVPHVVTMLEGKLETLIDGKKAQGG